MKKPSEIEKDFISEAERKAFAAVGRLGGKASFKKLGKKGMSELGKKGIKIRWDNYRKAKKAKKIIIKKGKTNV